jgi:hypothetical protein
VKVGHGSKSATQAGATPALGRHPPEVQKCVEDWTTGSQAKGFDPPAFTLYPAEGDHWVAVNRSSG